MSTSRRILALAWIPLVTWAISVGAAEIGFRVAGTRVAATMEGFYEPFGDHGFRHRPDATSFQNWASGPFHVRTDDPHLRLTVGLLTGGEAEIVATAELLAAAAGFTPARAGQR